VVVRRGPSAKVFLLAVLAGCSSPCGALVDYAVKPAERSRPLPSAHGMTAVDGDVYARAAVFGDGPRERGEYRLDVFRHDDPRAPPFQSLTLHASHFETLPFPPAVVEITVTTEDHRAAMTLVSAGTPDRLVHADPLTLEGGLWVHGVVVDGETAQPVAGAVVRVPLPIMCRDCTTEPYSPHTLSGRTGAYELVGLGRVAHVTASADGYVTTERVFEAEPDAGLTSSREQRFQLLPARIGKPTWPFRFGLSTRGVFVRPEAGDAGADFPREDEVFRRVGARDVSDMGVDAIGRLLGLARGGSVEVTLEAPDGKVRTVQVQVPPS
jgi:hypothetical protein